MLNLVDDNVKQNLFFFVGCFKEEFTNVMVCAQFHNDFQFSSFSATLTTDNYSIQPNVQVLIRHIIKFLTFLLVEFLQNTKSAFRIIFVHIHSIGFNNGKIQINIWGVPQQSHSELTFDSSLLRNNQLFQILLNISRNLIFASIQVPHQLMMFSHILMSSKHNPSEIGL